MAEWLKPPSNTSFLVSFILYINKIQFHVRVGMGARYDVIETMFWPDYGFKSINLLINLYYNFAWYISTEALDTYIKVWERLSTAFDMSL
jgi:hypothetical protein